MDTPSSSYFYKADLQNKLNLVASQVICALQSEVKSLEEEEHSYLQPRVQGMKYLQEVLETLKSKTKRLHDVESAFLRKEQLFRRAKLREFQANDSQPATDLETRKSLEEWLRSEAEGSMKLDLQIRRLWKQLQDLKKSKQCNKAGLKDINIIQARLKKQSDQNTKDLAELDREYRKLKDGRSAKSSDFEAKKSAPGDIFHESSQQTFGANSDTLREENNRLKQHLQQNFSNEALQALAKEQENLTAQYFKLQEQTRGLDHEVARSKKSSALLEQKTAQMQRLQNEQSLAHKDLVNRVDSQQPFLVELLQRKESLKRQIDAFNNQKPLLGKLEQKMSEMETTSESLAYTKKQLHKIEEEHTKFSNMMESLSKKLLDQQSLAANLEKQLKQQANDTDAEAEKSMLKQISRKLFEELQRTIETERAARNGRSVRQKQIEDMSKEARSMDERLESRKAERHKVEKDLRALTQEFDQIAEVCKQRQVEFLAKKEIDAELQEQVQIVEAEFFMAQRSCRAEMHENAVLRQTVVDLAQAMQRKMQMESED